MGDTTIAEPASATLPPRMGLLAEGLDFPTSAAFTDDGTLYVAESGLPFGGAQLGGRIVQIKNDGASQTVLEGLRAPVNGLAWADGGFYISEGGFPAASAAGRPAARGRPCSMTCRGTAIITPTWWRSAPTAGFISAKAR
jgi:hypothetical protein